MDGETLCKLMAQLGLSLTYAEDAVRMLHKSQSAILKSNTKFAIRYARRATRLLKLAEASTTLLFSRKESPSE